MRKLILAGMLALSGCGTSLTENSGILSLKVHWPEQPGQFSVAAIPPQTSLIVLEISGEGMGETLKSELKKSPDNSPASLKFTLPTGDKTLTARAFDRNQKLLALATSLVKIQAGQKHQALLDLQPVAPEKPQLAVPELGDAPKPQEPAPARSPASAPAPEARVPAPLRRLVEAVVEKVADKALPLARKQQEAKAGSTPTPAPTSTPSPTPVPSVTPTPAPTASPSILPVELPGDLPGGLGNRNKGNKK